LTKPAFNGRLAWSEGILDIDAEALLPLELP